MARFRKKRNKFNAHSVVIDGIRFPSKAEGAYYLQVRKHWGGDTGWTRQEKFVIISAFKCDGKRYSAATYKPDYIHRTNGVIDKVVDVKGGSATLTTDAALRMKLFAKRYGIRVTLARYDYRTGLFEEEKR